jgi:gliding motility-associated-like protein
MTITVNPANTVPVFTAIPPICPGGFLFPLSTTSMNSITGTWSPALNNSATTTYTFTPDAGQCATTATTIIIVDEMDFQIKGNCDNNNFVFTVSDPDGTFDFDTADFIWKNENGVTIGSNQPSLNASDYLNSTAEIELLPLVFSVTVSTGSGCTKTEPFVLESIYCDIQKGISPNSDTKNDFFDLALMGVKELTIFNRYGTKVYSKVNYRNEWYGQSDSNGELPDGTYYYVIEFASNLKSKTGWIYVNKQAN